MGPTRAQVALREGERREAMTGQPLVMSVLLCLAQVLVPSQPESAAITTRTVADMVVLLSPVRPPPTSCVRLESGDLDVAVQRTGRHPRGAIEFQFAGISDVTGQSEILVTQPVTREFSLLRLSVDPGVYCYSLLYKPSFATDAAPDALMTDEQQVTFMMVWVGSAARDGQGSAASHATSSPEAQ